MSTDTLNAAKGAHRALCVYATECRLFELDSGKPNTFHRSLPGPKSVKQEWVRFVERCYEDDIDPTSYIRRVFACQPQDTVPPMIHQIVRAPVATNYNLLGKQTVQELEVTLSSQAQIIARYLTLGSLKSNELVMGVAADPFIPLHPVIRLALAARSGLLRDWKLTEPLVVEAVLAYGRTPGLFDQVWGEVWVDRVLKEHGTRIYEQLLGLEVYT